MIYLIPVVAVALGAGFSARPPGGARGAAVVLVGVLLTRYRQVEPSTRAGRADTQGLIRAGTVFHHHGRCETDGMYAVTIAQPGGPEVLTWAEVPDPEVRPGEVLIDVHAAGSTTRRRPAGGALSASAGRAALPRPGVFRGGGRGRPGGDRVVSR